MIIKYSEISVKCTEGSLFICDLLLLIVLSFFYPQCRALQGSVASLTRLYSPVQVRRIRPLGNQSLREREKKVQTSHKNSPPPTLQELAVILCFYSVASKCVVIKKLDSHDPCQILSNLQCFEFNFASSSYSSYGANTATYFETSACLCVPRKYVLQARSY